MVKNVNGGISLENYAKNRLYVVILTGKSDRVLLDRDITKCLLLALIAFVLYFQNVVLHQIFENIFTRINNSMQEKLSQSNYFTD